ncbi:hypothetical protein L2735_18120 [Shewanella olleyana]|uniref:hypothetical protein n=1 Tax=Shewanella olleyana TaxID=135626 RepID=UPI00200C1803|nr:hypothetical protein [Shewanella olleyana]MCL1068690.1 hypothetical protein [Shewanella olleyana]
MKKISLKEMVSGFYCEANKTAARLGREDHISTSLIKEQSLKKTSSIDNQKLNIGDFALAITDNNGQVICQAQMVKQAIFNAMMNQLIEQFCNQYKSFNKDDFK